MLCVVLIIFFVLSLLFVRYGIKDKLSRFLILGHLCYWFICLIISTFNPFGLYEVSPDTYYIFILHTLSFLLGFFLIKPGGFCKNLFEISSMLRSAGYRVLTELNRIKIKKAMNTANREKIDKVIIIGEDELKQNSVTLKDMNSGEQELVKIDELISKLK